MSGKKPKERDKYVLRMRDGQEVPVSREVYECWYSQRRNERYQQERDRKYGVQSLEELEQQINMGRYGSENAAVSQENVEDRAVQNVLIEQLLREVDALQEEKRQLLKALYYDNMSLRAYAKVLGVSYVTVRYRRDQLLRDLRIGLKNK